MIVSIIIPTYQRPTTLTRAIDSVLRQTYSDVEVIVVDDNDPESDARRQTEQVMAAYMQPSSLKGKDSAATPSLGDREAGRVRYLQHPRNMNGSAARNTGASAARGELIGFLDDDDEFMPEKIASQVARMQELPADYALCYSHYFVDHYGKELYPFDESREGDLYFEALCRTFHPQPGSNLLIRKTAFDAIGGFDVSFQRSQDLELLTRLLQRYKIAYCSTPGLTVHAHNVTFQKQLEAIDFYTKKFQPFVAALPEDKQRTFRTEIAKQRLHILLRNHDYGKALSVISSRELSLTAAIRHIVSVIKIHFTRKRL